MRSLLSRSSSLRFSCFLLLRRRHNNQYKQDDDDEEDDDDDEEEEGDEDGSNGRLSMRKFLRLAQEQQR